MIYKIQIKQNGIFLNYLNFNKEEYCQIEFKNLDIQIIELVNRFGKFECYAIKFINGKRKYILNKNNEWSFSQIHQIICDLENIRKKYPFSIDGFHLKKDLEEKIKNSH